MAKKETVKTKTIKPSGVKITRKDETFTLAWKIADADYADGIAVQYRTNLQGWTTLATGKTATSRAVKLAVGNYFPSKKKYLQWVEMRVRGNRKTYKKKFKRKKKTIEQTIIPSVSDWSVARYTLKFPNQPSLSAALDNELTNKTTFTWSVTADSTSAPWFRGYYWETQLVKDCATGDGSKLAWNKNRLGWQSGTAGTSKVIVEDTAVIESGSYTRWFRVQARGPRGSSYWRYAKHIYALPYQAVIESAVATVQDSGGFQCKVVWTAAAPYAHPIDKTTVEYSIATPGEGLSCPDEASWTAARVSADTTNKDMAVFPIDTALAVDKCLFVRVNTEHDGVMTYGVPRLVTGGVGVLAKPTLTSVVLGDNHMVTINATNASAVPDSFMVVLYRPASNPTAEISIGIMEHGQTSKSFQAPDWDAEDSYAFGVYAAVGDPETITQDSALIKSDIEWGEGDVPKAPANVKVSATSVTGTIRVEWDWTWDKADGAELSWSDHEDAWESTDEPERYEISSIHSSHWNISGLKTGMKWYVKVRFKKGMGDNETYGPYSDAQIIDLTSAPSIPTLVLSSGVITESGSVTASWVYTTTDGTQQAYAEICEATITTNGIVHGSYKSSTDLYPIESKKYYQLVSGEYVEVQNIVYPDEDHRGDNPQEQGWLEYRDIIAKTDSVQHVTLSAEELGWKTGETYNLCVRVISASGRVSDEWSSPVPIMIAEPLEVNITETSFVEENIEVNPRTFSGNPISFETEIEEQFAELEVALEATQSGSGTPSPTNIRPIRGHSGVNAYVSPTQSADDGTKYSQEFDVSLTPTSTDKVPYTFKAVGQDVYGDRESDKIVGGTVAWNQLVQNGDFANADGWTSDYATLSVSGNVLTYTSTMASGSAAVLGNVLRTVGGHKYLVSADIKCNNTLPASGVWLGSGGHDGITRTVSELGKWTNISGVFVRGTGGKDKISLYPRSTLWNDGDTCNIRNIVCIDLTQMFGTTIADYIYSLEQSQAGAGVAWFKKLFPKDYYPYDPGTLLSVEGLASHDMVGFNAWDEEWELGALSATGGNATSSTEIRSKNYIPVVGGQTYYLYCAVASTFNYKFYDADKNFISGAYISRNNTLTIPTDARYMRFYMGAAYGTTYNHDICINLSDPTRNGEYEPHQKHSYSLDSSLTLRGMPKLDASNNLYYDGDTYESDGTVTRAFSDEYVIQASDIYQVDDTYENVIYARMPIKTGWMNSNSKQAINSKFGVGESVYPFDDAKAIGKMAINAWTNNYFFGFAKGTTLEQMKNALAGTTMVVKLATPTTETAEPFTNPQVVDNGGTEAYVTTGIVPVGHDTTYLTRDIFGGTLDLATGVLTVDRAMVDLSTLGWGVADGVRARSRVIDFTRDNGWSGDWRVTKSNVFNCVDPASAYSNRADYSFANISQNYYNFDIKVPNGAYADGTAFKSWLADVDGNGTHAYICIELATPQTYQLTPKQIQTLVGTNNVWGNGSLNVRITESVRNVLSLKEMPLTLTVEGAGENGTVSIVIERAAAYYINRPDETRFTGYENETIALYSQQGDGEITIADLIGALDDGAQYRLIATLQDDLGQSAEDSIDFEVHWTHQALLPEGTMEIDEETYIAKITPIAPTHKRVLDPKTEDIATYYELIEDEYVLTQDVEVDPTKTYYIAAQVAPTDVCDIYRLSADRPQLIVKDGAFGTTYVDPYMAIGDFGGYRLVFRTANGDYITENNEIAWLDLDEDILEIDYTVIDFAEGKIELFYNVDVSSTWTKDFTETKYLGGSVQGDWNPAVSRTGQISAVMLTITDKEQMQQIHRLAVDPSLCHVRTKDGASYAADVQVAESYSHEKEGLFATYTFTITRVDTEQLDGMTLQQWEEFQETE